MAFLAGCATTPREQIIRAWHFEPGTAELPEGEFARGTDRINGASANVAAAIRTKDGSSLLVQLPVLPPLPVGSPTRLRFRCRISDASKLAVQMFDLTVEDNRHIELPNLPANVWHSFDLDFTRDSKRNDGKHDVFAAGNRVDDVFFFVHGAGPTAKLWVDDVVLYSPKP